MLKMTSQRHRNLCHKQPKLRMRPWLINLIDSCTIPGLVWVDRNQLIFRVPWIHGSRQNWKQSDANLYIQWAEHRGKYSTKNDLKPNTKKFKATFRCALNSLPDCEEIVEKSQKTGQDAFKIYKFKEVEKTKKNKSRQKQELKEEEEEEEEEEQMSKDSFTSEQRLIPDTNSNDIIPRFEELFHGPLKAPFSSGGFYSVQENYDDSRNLSAQYYFEQMENSFAVEEIPSEVSFFDEQLITYTEVTIATM